MRFRRLARDASCAGKRGQRAESSNDTVLIDQTTIREVLARTDIGSFIGGYVSLRKRGNDLVGLCPFHGEKTPSFHVHPDRGFFKCFGCGKGGDAIGFLRELENLTFTDAVRALARRAGVEVEAETPATARVRGEKERIYAANEFAAAYFVRMLRSATGAPAREYLARRGFDDATVAAFKLGFAPPGWDGLTDELRAAGIELDIAEKAGLVKPGQYGPYDAYRNRVIVPTYATTGEAIAFGGRALDDSEPKYLNTSTTPVYTKGRGLFALNVARRSAAARDALVVVEGYLDCIALHQAGFTHAVASLGTSFTAEQAAELRKYAERILICFDGDAAGLAATVKAVGLLETAGCAPYVVRLPLGEDPDSYVKATGGIAAFAARLDEALESGGGAAFVLDRELDRLLDLKLPPPKCVAAVNAHLAGRRIEERDRLLVHAAARLGIPVDDFRSAVAAGRVNHAPRGAAPGRLAGSRHVAPGAEPPSIEREILAAFVDEPGLVHDYASEIPLDVFRDARYRDIYRALCEIPERFHIAADVYAAFAADAVAMELLVALQRPDRSSRVRFPDTQARRAHLDRVIEGLIESRLESRRRELSAAEDAAFTAGLVLPQTEKDELARVRRELEGRRKRRLAAR